MKHAVLVFLGLTAWLALMLLVGHLAGRWVKRKYPEWMKER